MGVQILNWVDFNSICFFFTKILIQFVIDSIKFNLGLIEMIKQNGK
jgi:hypothetical protein